MIKSINAKTNQTVRQTNIKKHRVTKHLKHYLEV